MLDDEVLTPDQLLYEVNNLMDSREYEEAYSLVLKCLSDSQFQIPNVYSVLSRLCLNIADIYSRADKEKYEFYINTGYRFAKTGCSLNENHPGCVKYVALFFERKLWLKGTKRWIEKSFDLKQQLLKSLSFDQNDPIILHKIGLWCFEVTGWTWVQKKFAYALFKEPPRSSYQEALKYFLSAEGN
uniref:Uncharacterized protein n=1 Tax=Trichobilharzia regenti TaxID=157069 RepID=A0AA85IQC3_TRIRE|nr:unnamed protein product [Trichobilharzia regenti]